MQVSPPIDEILTSHVKHIGILYIKKKTYIYTHIHTYICINVFNYIIYIYIYI